MKIEKGIPITHFGGSSRRGMNNELRKIMKIMEVGDSVLITKKYYVAFGPLKKEFPEVKFSARAVGKEYRIWRTE